MASGPSEKGRAIRISTELFQHIELVVYVALGILLSVTALLSLGSATLLLLEGMRDWSGTRAIFLIVDRLMFVLMLVEILHTVRGSVRSGALTPEPFLIMGLIASIRNVSRHHPEVIGHSPGRPRVGRGRDVVPLLNC